jgi:predicted deacetylase
MDMEAWTDIEAVLLETGARPILAVVPDCQDRNLMIDPPDPHFWDKVRTWQARGWAIGLHGFQHAYVNDNAGVVGLTAASEFAGLPYQVQHDKLRQGLEIFAREGVHPDVFVAPAHSFDQTTVQVLKDLGIQAISDGMGLGPYTDLLGTTWVPQQFAVMRHMPFGVWTFCYHLNYEPPEAIAALKANLRRHQGSLISLQEALALGRNRKKTVLDRLVGFLRKMVTLSQRMKTV